MTPQDKQKLKKAYDKWRHDNHLYGQSAGDSIADWWLSKLEEAVNNKVEEVRGDIQTLWREYYNSDKSAFYEQAVDSVLSLPSLQIKPKE